MYYDTGVPPPIPPQIAIAAARRVTSRHVISPFMDRYIGNEAADLFDACYEFANPTGYSNIATSLRRGQQSNHYVEHTPVILAVDLNASQLGALRSTLERTAVPYHILALGSAGTIT